MYHFQLHVILKVISVEPNLKMKLWDHKIYLINSVRSGISIQN